MSEATWAEINAVSATNDAASVWSIGDSTNISANNETLTIEIVGFNVDKTAAGEIVGISFGMTDLMASRRAMNSKTGVSGGFASQDLCKWLNETVFDSLNSELQNVIKPVVKKTASGNNDSTIISDNLKLWLFSASETGKGTHLSLGSQNEGSKYPVFSKNAVYSKKLSNGSGSIEPWWTRSPATMYGNFVYIDVREENPSHIPTSYNMATETRGICFGFCV